MDFKEEVYKELEKCNFRLYKKIQEKFYDYFELLIKKHHVASYQEAFFIEYNNETAHCKYGNKKKFKTITTGYSYCSSSQNKCKCWNDAYNYGKDNFWKNISDEDKSEMSNKRKKTMMDKYGVESAMHLDKVKSKIKQTNLDRYGHECSLLGEEVKEKTKKTNLERYGVNNPGKSKLIQDKIKQTNLEKYGVPYSTQHSSVKEKIKITNIEKYGVPCTLLNPEIQEKIKQTNIEKYGTETPAITEEVQQKSKKTNIEKYGVEFYTQTDQYKIKVSKKNLEKYGNICSLHGPSTKEKSKKTFLERYGHVNPMMNYGVRKKLQKTLLERYGTENYMQHHYDIKYKNIFENSEKFKDALYKYGTYELAKLINCDVSTIHKNALKFNIQLPPRSRSYQEQILIALFEKHNINFICNDRKKIAPYELDFYLPDTNIAFELNGLYWHSEKFKDKNYHYDKWKLCQDKGIDLYSIFEDDFSDMWINKILHLCNVSMYDRVYARNCEIVKIDGKIAKQFLNQNHLQGNKYSSINIGLYYQDELVSVMSFSNTRNNNNGVAELTRFCNRMDTQIIGGASKLLSYFIKHYGNNYNEIISFSDNTYSDGGLYNTLGFNLVNTIGPDYRYIVNNKRSHKTNFRKSKIQEKFDLDSEFVKNHTEKELMDMLGIFRIWDCGKKKWAMALK